MSVDTHFYPLGSCTMKYNPKRNERVAALPGLADLHPYQPEETLQGLLGNCSIELQEMLGGDRGAAGGVVAAGRRRARRIDGACWSLRPISATRARSGPRCSIPDAAHGTNPASAAMAGFEAVTVKSDAQGHWSIWKICGANSTIRRRRVHDHQPEHARAVRSADRRDRATAYTTRGPGVPGRCEHERDPGHHPAGRFRRRHDALQPAQDLQRPAWRRRPWSADRSPLRGAWRRSFRRRSCVRDEQGGYHARRRPARSRSAACGASSAIRAC